LIILLAVLTAAPLKTIGRKQLLTNVGQRAACYRRYMVCPNPITERYPMKKLTAILVATSLALTTTSVAYADGGRHHGWHGHQRHHHHHHRSGPNWVGPAAVLAIAGMAIGSAAYSNAYAAPAPVYSGPVYAPPAAVYSAPPARSAFWYFCGSSGQYYPYTNACPEGWQAVPAR